MRTTRSRLSTLLRVREIELAGAGAGYARAARGLAVVDSLARERAHRAARGRESLLRRARAGESAVVLRTAVAGVRRLGDASLDAVRELESARAVMERAHARLLAARTRVRTLEGLRDRFEQEERDDLQRRAQRELDEIALRRAGYGKRES
jgi:flagellar export protein FliJ